VAVAAEDLVEGVTECGLHLGDHTVGGDVDGRPRVMDGAIGPSQLDRPVRVQGQAPAAFVDLVMMDRAERRQVVQVVNPTGCHGVT
jgi:hypothetical protein